MVKEYDVTGTVFEDGVTNFNMCALESAVQYIGIPEADWVYCLIEMSQTLFDRCKKYNLVDDDWRNPKKKLIQGVQVVVDPTMVSAAVTKVRIYDKTDQLVGVLKVREW